MDNTIEVIERGDYRVTIWRDIYAECPVQTCDMAAVHLFEYDGWLSDGCDWREFFGDNRHTLSEAVARLAMENVSLAKIVRYIAAGQLEGTRLHSAPRRQSSPMAATAATLTLFNTTY